MTHAIISQKDSRQIAHNLMHLDQDSSGVLRVKRERLHMRVDLAPLLRPVSANLFRSTDKAPFERARPSYIRRHESESRINVPRVESRIGRAEQFDVC